MSKQRSNASQGRLQSVQIPPYTSANFTDSVFKPGGIEGDATRTPIAAAPLPATLWLFLGAGAVMLRQQRARRRSA